MRPYYECDGITIYHGDCREVLSVPCDAVITDPPFNVNFAYASYRDNLSEEDYATWLADIWARAELGIRPAGSLVWFWPAIRVARGEARACLPTNWRMWHLGASYRRDFAGDLWKSNHPALSWQAIVWACRERQTPGYFGPKGGHAGRDCLVANHPRHDKGTGDHPCPQPQTTVRAVVEWVTPPEGTVVDPFCGSGTTLWAAKQVGRRAIGIEIEERYCEIAARRLDQTVLAL